VAIFVDDTPNSSCIMCLCCPKLSKSNSECQKETYFEVADLLGPETPGGRWGKDMGKVGTGKSGGRQIVRNTFIG